MLFECHPCRLIFPFPPPPPPPPPLPSSPFFLFSPILAQMSLFAGYLKLAKEVIENVNLSTLYQFKQKQKNTNFKNKYQNKKLEKTA